MDPLLESPPVFQVVRLREGYDMAEVDAFVADVQRKLREDPPGISITDVEQAPEPRRLTAVLLRDGLGRPVARPGDRGASPEALAAGRHGAQLPGSGGTPGYPRDQWKPSRGGQQHDDRRDGVRQLRRDDAVGDLALPLRPLRLHQAVL